MVRRIRSWGVAYTVIMFIVFTLTHSRRPSLRPSIDSSLMVAALSAQVVLAGGLAILFVLAAVFHRRNSGRAGDRAGDTLTDS